MAENKKTPEELAYLQSLPLDVKIRLTRQRIREFYETLGGNCYVSFSGGKDSTVLLDIARGLYPDIPAVFSNTGLEYPEIYRFVKSHDNVEIVTPKMRFDEVISRYGYPLIGKEVAEAIYYARRLTPNARERERESDLVQTSAHANRRPVLMGAYPASTHKRGSEQNSTGNAPQVGTQRESISGRAEQPRKTSRGNETDRRRKDIAGERGTGVEKSGMSQFNKEKWLPLARDVPIPISHYCCSKIKKAPLMAFYNANGVRPILAMMADESRIRKQAWMRTGCNAFDGIHVQSTPMAFWTEQDVLQYIIDNDLPIASVYGDIVSVDDEGNEYDPHGLLFQGCKLKCTGCERTGCIFCGFGFHLEKGETRFQRLARTHPRQYEYCLGGGQWVDNPAYDPVAPEYDGDWKNWNPKQIWVPSKKGLGMKYVFDSCNEIYGKNFYRYE